MCWAASGKDPGYTPLSLLDLLRRRGRYQAVDFARLHLAEPVDLVELKSEWRQALEQAEQFIRERPADEFGCLYHSQSRGGFVTPVSGDDSVPHYGRPGGVLPAATDG